MIELYKVLGIALISLGAGLIVGSLNAIVYGNEMQNVLVAIVVVTGFYWGLLNYFFSKKIIDLLTNVDKEIEK